MTTTEYLSTFKNKEVEIYCGKWVTGKVAECAQDVVTLTAAQGLLRIRTESILSVSQTI